MAVLIGTRDGVYRTETLPVEDADHVLDSGDTPRVHTFPAVDGVFAASKSGLYRSVDEGQTWENLGVPQEEVYSVVASSDGEHLYAGTHPAHLYVSTDDGETWNEFDGFQDLPSRDQWHTPRHRNEAHIRSLGVHSETPDRVIAGVDDDVEPPTYDELGAVRERSQLLAVEIDTEADQLVISLTERGEEAVAPDTGDV